ncbi:MAG: T9SS type A sorting domain-containing protein [Bacteroidia bacterium]
MRFSGFFVLFTILFFCSSCLAQPYFQWNDSVEVKADGTLLRNPWAGGLNFIQASNIDLDLDGVSDLFIFDRTGNKVRTFLNKGSSNTVDYKYDPRYESRFPPMHDWALLVDYNCDNKEDIFTSSGGGFAIYKNISTIVNGLQFELVTMLQHTNYNPGSNTLAPLYILPIDIPSFSDIDNDGDLDVITFTSSSNYIQYHQNQSMELYGLCDSLVFEIKNRCWGYISESSLSNNYTLFDTCSGNISNPGIVESNTGERENAHQGGCSLCMDLDGDNDKDLIVGDVSYTNLTMFTNGGTPSAGSFVSKDAVFPVNNGAAAQVSLPVFPCAYAVDVNSDGMKDLIVSPNSANISENFNSVLYYQNVGSMAMPAFQLQQDNFLQSNMIELSEGAYPVFFDYNNDGLKDLFVGNYGYYISSGFGFQTKIALFKNTGTAAVPQFTLITRDYANLSSLGINNMVPAFGDMDADGDSDMIIGGYDGKLHYFENTAAVSDSAVFVLTQSSFKNSANRTIDVGDFAAPQIVDVDGDQKNDLVVGSRNGKLAYYHHTGSASAAIPSMDSVSHYWGNVKVTRPGYFVGYSYPFVFKQNGSTKLLVGQESGRLSLFDNIDGNINGVFALTDSAYQDIFQGTRTSPCGADINNDGLMDLIVGNYEGGLSFYKGSANNPLSLQGVNDAVLWDVLYYPNPANSVLSVKIKNHSSKKYLLNIYNTMGQQVYSQRIYSDLWTVNASELPQGVYICRLSEIDANSRVLATKVKRIVIQH